MAFQLAPFYIICSSNRVKRFSVDRIYNIGHDIVNGERLWHVMNTNPIHSLAMPRRERSYPTIYSALCRSDSNDWYSQWKRTNRIRVLTRHTNLDSRARFSPSFRPNRMAEYYFTSRYKFRIDRILRVHFDKVRSLIQPTCKTLQQIKKQGRVHDEE